MRTIDIHAHLMPQCFWNAVAGGGNWYGMTHEPQPGNGFTVSNGKRDGVSSPMLRSTVEERIKDMDAQGVDVHLVSVATPLFGYHLPPDQGLKLAQEVNEEIASMTRQYPQRFVGMATLPVQDIPASIKELERAVTTLGFKGVELDTVVNGKSWDEPEFLPLFKAAEEMGAVLFYHPQPNNNLVMENFPKFAMGNSFGVPLEDALVVAALIFGGILDKCPDLKVCVAHGGGPACFGMGRMDRGWQVRSEARVNIDHPPSYYQSKIYYDCITMSERALRFLIDTVGIDRVVLGSDWPYVAWEPSPVAWINGLESLSQAEKEQILWKNLEQLLGI
ncbi:MAG: amidohydrolase family protein [Chloroflexi bacterium]|nr:amidohydrolase family protein [Chloroflexota bacterium]MDA1218502.1 amidohydrolase family protein [Chloroflexota bacterium]